MPQLRFAGGRRSTTPMAKLTVGVIFLLAACSSAPGTQQAQGGDTATDPISVPDQEGTGPATSSSQPTTENTVAVPVFEPTPVADGAYGEFSGESWTTVDFIEVTRRIVECVQDHGFSLAVIPPGDGISYQDVPEEQRQPASAQEEECRRSMAIPEFAWPTPEELRVIYEYNVKLNDCLESLGFATTPPPSFEVFQDSYTTGPWMAYFGSDLGAADVETMRKCPQVPPGGFGAWDIGDPIKPLPDP